MKLVSRSVVYPFPANASAAYEYSYRRRPSGYDKLRARFLDVSNDIFDRGSPFVIGDRHAGGPASPQSP